MFLGFGLGRPCPGCSPAHPEGEERERRVKREHGWISGVPTPSLTPPKEDGGDFHLPVPKQRITLAGAAAAAGRPFGRESSGNGPKEPKCETSPPSPAPCHADESPAGTERRRLHNAGLGAQGRRVGGLSPPDLNPNPVFPADLRFPNLSLFQLGWKNGELKANSQEMKLQPVVSPWARGRSLLPVPQDPTPHLTLHPTNLVCSWEPQKQSPPLGCDPAPQPSQHRVLKSLLLRPQGYRRSRQAPQLPPAPAASKAREQLTSPLFLRNSTKIKPWGAAGGNLLGQGSPFPSTHSVPGLAPPSWAGDSPHAPTPLASSSPGGLGLRE